MLAERSRGTHEATVGFVYILECCDGTFYTGSTVSIEKRLEQHSAGEGAKYTSKRLPVKLVYVEEYAQIDTAFEREKHIQGWSHKKKQALINGDFKDVRAQAGCRNITHHKFRNLREV